MHDKHLRNAALAKATGVHVTTVSQWLNDKFEPDPSNLETLANLLGVSVGWLRFGDVTGTAATTGGASTTQGTGTVGEPDRAASVPTVSIPLHVLTYWRGRVEEQVHSISGVARSLSALQGMLEQATASMTEFVDSNVLPGPQTVDDLVAGGAWPQGERVTLPPREESERALAALRARAAEREAAARQPAEPRPVAPKRRAGTGR